MKQSRECQKRLLGVPPSVLEVSIRLPGCLSTFVGSWSKNGTYQLVRFGRRASNIRRSTPKSGGVMKMRFLCIAKIRTLCQNGPEAFEPKNACAIDLSLFLSSSASISSPPLAYPCPCMPYLLIGLPIHINPIRLKLGLAFAEGPVCPLLNSCWDLNVCIGILFEGNAPSHDAVTKPGLSIKVAAELASVISWPRRPNHMLTFGMNVNKVRPSLIRCQRVPKYRKRQKVRAYGTNHGLSCNMIFSEEAH